MNLLVSLLLLATPPVVANPTSVSGSLCTQAVKTSPSQEAYTKLIRSHPDAEKILSIFRALDQAGQYLGWGTLQRVPTSQTNAIIEPIWGSSLSPISLVRRARAIEPDQTIWLQALGKDPAQYKRVSQALISFDQAIEVIREMKRLRIPLYQKNLRDDPFLVLDDLTFAVVGKSLKGETVFEALTRSGYSWTDAIAAAGFGVTRERLLQFLITIREAQIPFSSSIANKDMVPDFKEMSFEIFGRPFSSVTLPKWLKSYFGSVPAAFAEANLKPSPSTDLSKFENWTPEIRISTVLPFLPPSLRERYRRLGTELFPQFENLADQRAHFLTYDPEQRKILVRQMTSRIHWELAQVLHENPNVDSEEAFFALRKTLALHDLEKKWAEENFERLYRQVRSYLLSSGVHHWQYFRRIYGQDIDGGIRTEAGFSLIEILHKYPHRYTSTDEATLNQLASRIATNIEHRFENQSDKLSNRREQTVQGDEESESLIESHSVSSHAEAGVEIIEERRGTAAKIHRVLAILQTLPLERQKAFRLYYLEDRSLAEISAELGVVEGTIKSHIHRAREAIKEILQNEQGED